MNNAVTLLPPDTHASSMVCVSRAGLRVGMLGSLSSSSLKLVTCCALPLHHAD